MRNEHCYQLECKVMKLENQVKDLKKKLEQQTRNSQASIKGAPADIGGM